MPAANNGMAGFSQPYAQNMNMTGRIGGNFGSGMPLLNAPAYDNLMPKGKPKDYKGGAQAVKFDTLHVSSFKIVPLAEQIEKYCCGLPKGIKKYCTKTSVMNMAQLLENAEVADDLIQGKPDEDGFKTRQKEPQGKQFSAKGNATTWLTGTCKLLTDLDLYRQPMLTTAAGDHTLQNSGSKSMDYVPICDEDLPITEEHYFEHQNLEMERNILNVQEQGKADCEQMSFQDSFINKGESFYGEVNSQSKVHGGRFTFTLSDSDNKVQSPREGLFLCTNDHVDCFIRGLADVIEREVGLFTPDEVALKLSQLEKLAPDTFKVHYLKYLNSLSNGDYPAALDSLHRYFDYRSNLRGS
ncbi:hypothetical protein L7F22_003884 [Adiantum nelumboides]|nr:hypothetical protein [Adiantum nelumboides]